MTKPVRKRFWFEAALAGLSTALLILTVRWPDWIERFFGVEPDGGDGSLEWALVIVLAVTTVVTSIIARREWHRGRRLVTE